MAEQTTSTIASTIGNYTAYMVIAILFVLLLKWVLNHFKDTRKEYIKLLEESSVRENNYQAIITKLSNELPQIRETLQSLERKIK